MYTDMQNTEHVKLNTCSHVVGRSSLWQGTRKKKLIVIVFGASLNNHFVVVR